MRKFKFRIWNKVESKMIEAFNENITVITLSGLNVLSIEPGIMKWTDIIGKEFFEIVQYTGFKDKNGKDIYEGDIVKGTTFRGIVEWSERYGKYWIKLADNRHGKTTALYHNAYAIEITGNIYENPELV